VGRATWQYAGVAPTIRQRKMYTLPGKVEGGAHDAIRAAHEVLAAIGG
jgi:hypothetical protein